MITEEFLRMAVWAVGIGTAGGLALRAWFDAEDKAMAKVVKRPTTQAAPKPTFLKPAA